MLQVDPIHNHHITCLLIYIFHNVGMLEIEQSQLRDTRLNNTPSSIRPSARPRI